ncbi:MAG TPA: LppX_LprAFG lipoprotein [Chloroflexota bacterium]|nr:LppX_LprAFG lipoprotein [Chloroflexota bacterium]
MRTAALGLLLVVLAACAGVGAPAATPTPALTEQEIAQRAVDRLGALSSFHFELATDTGGKPLGSTAFALVSASGDAARPDKLSASLQASVGGFVAAVSYVSAGGKHFMTDPISRQWMEVPPQFNTIAVFSPETGAPAIVKSLQGLKRQPTEQVEGVDSYHLAGTAPGDVLLPLLGAAAPAQLKADVWIGNGDFLTRRITLTGAILQGEPETTVRTLKLSRFDQPVDIQAPTPGTPAS